MRLFPESPDEVDQNLQWGVQALLDAIEEVVYESPDFRTAESDIDEAWQRIVRSWKRRDRTAEEEAAVDGMRAAVRTWWQSFGKRRLLTDLFGRQAKRREESGSRDAGAPRLTKKGSRLPRVYCRTSRRLARWTPQPSLRPLRRPWQSNGSFPSALSPPALCCENAVGLHSIVAFTLTRYASTAKTLTRKAS